MFRVPSLPLQKCPQIVDPGGRSALRSDDYAPAALVRQAVRLGADRLRRAARDVRLTPRVAPGTAGTTHPYRCHVEGYSPQVLSRRIGSAGWNEWFQTLAQRRANPKSSRAGRPSIGTS